MEQFFESQDSKSGPPLAEYSYICCGEVTLLWGTGRWLLYTWKLLVTWPKKMCLPYVSYTSAKSTNSDWAASPLNPPKMFYKITVYEPENKHIVENIFSQKKYFSHFIFSKRFFIKSTIFLLRPIKSNRWL